MALIRAILEFFARLFGRRPAVLSWDQANVRWDQPGRKWGR